MTAPLPLASAAWLLEHLGDPDARLADCRFTLGQPEAGRERYRAAHLPGAVYLDLERDLSGPRSAGGGRHPLPDPGALAARLGELGLGDGHTVIAYDDAGGLYASRLWWLLRWLGHDGGRVLDGSLAAYLEAGGTLTAEMPELEPASFTPRPRPEMVTDAGGVAARPAGSVLIDSRAAARYAGQVEPIDPVAGHIPGAVNRDWADSLGPDGRFRSAAAQAERFAGVAAKDTIVYCGSGVSAAANLLALELAGKPGARLYAGSWSDWITDPARPVATGEEA